MASEAAADQAWVTGNIGSQQTSRMMFPISNARSIGCESQELP